MTSPATSVARCDDGTVMPVDWAYPGAEEYEWVWNQAHWPQALTPMAVWLLQNSLPGVDRAWTEAGIEPLAMFYRNQVAGPFIYSRMTPYEPARMAAIANGYHKVAQRHGSILGFWQQFCQPRIQQVCSDLAAETNSPMRSIAEARGYGLHQTFTSAALLREAMTRLTEVLAESVGADAMLMAHEVTQGGKNASQAIDGEIWELAALARRTPAAMRLLTSNAQGDVLPSLRHEPALAAFAAAFEALIERHGSRSQGVGHRAAHVARTSGSAAIPRARAA